MSDFVMCMEMSAWVLAVSEGGWNVLRTETRTSPISCAVWDAYWSTFRKRGNDQCSSLRSDAQQSFRARKSEEENCHPSTWQREASQSTSDLADNSKNAWELLSHPPYSPDLVPSENHLFGSLKDHLRGHHYKTDKAVQEAVQSWSRGAGTDFYCRGIFKILQRWHKCTDRDVEFVEK
jgi:hypothetical protein